MKPYIIFIFCVITLTGFAQQIINVRSVQEGKQVVITYDIIGGSSTDKLEVTLYYAQNNSDFKQATLGLTGDFGPGITPGTNKTIRWSPLKELNKITGTGFSFKVKATIKASDPYGIAATMVLVEGGTFTMGCTGEQGSECSGDEKPAHNVTLKSFSISKYEVTQALWEAVVSNNPSIFRFCDKCPVENVSWNDIQEFISRLNQQTGQDYRLPTEAEWEYAARGGNKSRGYKYSGSNNIYDVAWFDNNTHNQTYNVGRKQPNELGIYDMSGNVWEWCSDWYNESYYNQSLTSNPSGAQSGEFRVVRGGSYNYNDGSCRLTNRSRNAPDSRLNNLGFRLAHD